MYSTGLAFNTQPDTRSMEEKLLAIKAMLRLIEVQEACELGCNKEEANDNE